MKHTGMPRGTSFKAVESIARTLPEVEVTTTWGQLALKVRGKMFACIASHKSAEPNTLVVMMDFADRDALGCCVEESAPSGTIRCCDFCTIGEGFGLNTNDCDGISLAHHFTSRWRCYD